MSEELLTKEQVQETVEFADAIYNIERYGFYSPWMSNTNLINLNNTPKTPKVEKLRKALADYKESGIDLQDYTEFMSHYDMLFARTLKSYSNLLSFDLQVTCSNAFTLEDYKSEDYKKDKRIINKFLDAFDYKSEFTKVMEQVMRSEVGYYSYRVSHGNTKNMKATLQLLPQRYCMLTGYWERGLLTDFDMNYFLQAGVDIDGYAPAFKKYFNNVFGEDQIINNYKPSNQFKERNGVYAMWTQTSPDDIWAFKLDPSSFDVAPFLAPYLKSALTNDDIEKLQRSKDIASAYALLVGELRLFDNAKSGTKADQFAINPKTLADFMKKIKSGMPEEYKAVAMPTENTKFYQYADQNKDAYNNQLMTSAGTGSSLSRVIYSSDRMSNAELQYSAEAQAQIVKPMYSQFENFLEYFANKLTKKYHFKFHFEGINYEFDREARFDKLLKIADKGIVPNISAFAAVMGYKPQQLERSLMESKATGWAQELSQLLLNVNTTAQNTDSGRPQLDSTDISDSAEKSRNQ